MRRFVLPAFAVLLLAVLASCSDSVYGIFQSIQLERKIDDDRALDNELTVSSIAGAGERYFIATGALWYRNDTDPDYVNEQRAQWTWVAPPAALGTGALTSALTAFNGAVYVVFTSADGASAGLYALDAAALPDPPDSEKDLRDFAEPAYQIAADEAVPLNAPAAVSGIGRLFTVDDGSFVYLIVSVATETAGHTLTASTTGAGNSFTEVAGVAALSGNLPVTDIAWTGAGEIAYLTRRTLLVDTDGIVGANPPLEVTNLPLEAANPDYDPDADPPGSPTIVRQPSFGGVFYSSDGSLWLSDDEGYLYRSADNGATWTINGAATGASAVPHRVAPSDSTSDPLSFTVFAEVDNAGTPLLLVGTSGHGYRALGDPANPVTPFEPDLETSNYPASDLSNATVLTLFVVPGVTGFVPNETGTEFTSYTGDRLFAGTAERGLWRTLYYGSPPQWIQE